jgi:nucleotide-binding universal stress UspA family protein
VYRKILVGSDGSTTASKAVDRAVDMAESLGASLTIVAAGRREWAERVVAAEAERHQAAEVAIDTKVVEGEPAAALVVAAAGYDLLVTGNRGMTGISRFFSLGSVPNRLSHHLPCSLLIVKTT